jgi:hypothetical protein
MVLSFRRTPCVLVGDSKQLLTEPEYRVVLQKRTGGWYLTQFSSLEHDDAVVAGLSVVSELGAAIFQLIGCDVVPCRQCVSLLDSGLFDLTLTCVFFCSRHGCIDNAELNRVAKLGRSIM